MRHPLSVKIVSEPQGPQFQVSLISSCNEPVDLSQILTPHSSPRTPSFTKLPDFSQAIWQLCSHRSVISCAKSFAATLPKRSKPAARGDLSTGGASTVDGHVMTRNSTRHKHRKGQEQLGESDQSVKSCFGDETFQFVSSAPQNCRELAAVLPAFNQHVLQWWPCIWRIPPNCNCSLQHFTGIRHTRGPHERLPQTVDTSNHTKESLSLFLGTIPTSVTVSPQTADINWPPAPSICVRPSVTTAVVAAPPVWSKPLA